MRDILKRFKPDRLEHLTALNALYRPGPMADDRRLHQAAARADQGRLRPPAAGADPVRHLRRHGLPGAGHADRLRPGRLHAGRGRHPAQGHGQEEGRRDGHPEGQVPEGLRRAQRAREEGRQDLGPHGAVRGLRLQQVPLRGLRLAGLPDRPTSRPTTRLLHGRPAHLGAREHRQDGGVHRRVPGHGHPGPAARRQRVGHLLHRGRGGRTPRSHPLRPGRHQERGRGGGGGGAEGAAGRGPSAPCSTSASGWTCGP